MLYHGVFLFPVWLFSQSIAIYNKQFPLSQVSTQKEDKTKHLWSGQPDERSQKFSVKITPEPKFHRRIQLQSFNWSI